MAIVVINIKNLKNKTMEKEKNILRERFGENPFSILDTKTGWWQAERKKWIELGIKSEEGRGENLLKYSDALLSNGKKYAKSFNIGFGAGKETEWKAENDKSNGTSIFDPYLCELMYKWFCPADGKIIDPFAGGSVRGIVAAKLGYQYTGIELRSEQVEANIKQGEELIPENQPKWICGDSNQELDKIDEKFDLIFSCPPYADLEVYSDLKEDLSNMDYDKFLLFYRAIILKAVEKLKNGCFAIFVVGDVRGEDGYYYDFISDTKKAFINAGAKLYNEAVLLNSIGMAALRANDFGASKKLIKIHQNILIFKKEGEINEELKMKIKSGYELSKHCPKCGSKDGIYKLKSRNKAGKTHCCQDCVEYFTKEELGL